MRALIFLSGLALVGVARPAALAQSTHSAGLCCWFTVPDGSGHVGTIRMAHRLKMLTFRCDNSVLDTRYYINKNAS